MNVIGSPKHRSCLTIEVAERDCLTLSRSTSKQWIQCWPSKHQWWPWHRLKRSFRRGGRFAWCEVIMAIMVLCSFWRSHVIQTFISTLSIHFTVQVDEGGLAHGKKIPQPPSLHSLLFAFKSEPLVYTVEICGLHPHWTWVMHFRALSC